MVPYRVWIVYIMAVEMASDGRRNQGQAAKHLPGQ